MNSLNTQIAEVVPERKDVFLLANLMEMGDNQVMVIGMEFFNTIILASMPPHRMALKVGIHVILPKNLNAALGLYNGTHLFI